MDISKLLLEEFRKSEQDASILVETKLSIYPDHIEEYKPNVPYQKIIDGYEISKRKPKREKKEYSTPHPQYSEDNTERSLRRTRKQITDLVICNDFDTFGTFTFREDRDDPVKCKRKMSTWLTNQKKKNGHFRYLIVQEFHKDKKSIHFHILLGGYTGKLTLARNPHTKAPLKIKGRQQYNFAEYKLGHSQAEFINSKKKAGYYLRKYITKGMVLFPGKKRYWPSRGLSIPDIEYNPLPYYYDFEIDDVWWNEIGSKVRYLRPKDG
jgi:hypothetical protein